MTGRVEQRPGLVPVRSPARVPWRLFGILLAALLLSACNPATNGGGGPDDGAARAVAPVTDSAFGALVRDLSEPGGYFDTDNLISNESSYLHVVGELEARGVRGGVYIGVGPAQNFSYMVAVRPELAFLVDIRRDNLLQHLWFKALFERSETRLDYLCAMVGRACGGPSSRLDLGSLVRAVDAAALSDTLDALIDAVAVHAADAGVPLEAGDTATIRAIHRRFARAGLDLRFNSHGRVPMPSYPTLRDLLLERDREGRRVNYLSGEAGYRYLAGLQRRNRVVPVVGDLAGDYSLRAIGREATRRGLTVSALYASNVEFYLFGADVFHRYAANLAELPVTDGSVVIRSYFNRFRPIPETVPGYASTQLLQTIPALLADWQEGRVTGYSALIVRSEG